MADIELNTFIGKGGTLTKEEVDENWTKVQEHINMMKLSLDKVVLSGFKTFTNHGSQSFTLPHKPHPDYPIIFVYNTTILPQVDFERDEEDEFKVILGFMPEVTDYFEIYYSYKPEP